MRSLSKPPVRLMEQLKDFVRRHHDVELAQNELDLIPVEPPCRLSNLRFRSIVEQSLRCTLSLGLTLVIVVMRSGRERCPALQAIVQNSNPYRSRMQLV